MKELELDGDDRPYKLYFLVGNSGTGKSHLVKYLARKLQKLGLVDGCLVFTGTAFSKGAYDFIDSKYVTKYSNRILATFMEKVEKDIKERNILKNYLLILDDIGSDRRAMDSAGAFNALMTQYRHFRVNCINVCQSATMFSPTVRDNMTISFVFPPVVGRNFNYVYSLCGTRFTKDDFEKLLNEVAKRRYQVLVCNTLKNDDCYSFFKAPAEIPEFMLNSS